MRLVTKHAPSGLCATRGHGWGDTHGAGPRPHSRQPREMVPPSAETGTVALLSTGGQLSGDPTSGRFLGWCHEQNSKSYVSIFTTDFYSFSWETPNKGLKTLFYILNFLSSSCLQFVLRFCFSPQIAFLLMFPSCATCDKSSISQLFWLTHTYKPVALTAAKWNSVLMTVWVANFNRGQKRERPALSSYHCRRFGSSSGFVL